MGFNAMFERKGEREGEKERGRARWPQGNANQILMMLQQTTDTDRRRRRRRTTSRGTWGTMPRHANITAAEAATSTEAEIDLYY